MATQDEVRCIATEAAREAITQVFLKLGIDTEDPGEVIKFQQDISELREMVRSYRDVRSKGTIAVILTLIAGVLGLVWMGFKAQLK